VTTTWIRELELVGHAEADSGMPAVLVKAGPLAGERLDIESELVLGRGNADFTIEDVKISNRHALIRPIDGALEIEDLDSSNGTWVNDVRIVRPTRLHSGDVVRLGETLLEVLGEPVPDPLAASGPSATVVESAPASGHVLLVREGPVAGQRLDVDSELVLGREADLTIDDPQISRRHAVIKPIDGALEVADLGSLNGTWVNGRRITTPVRLSPGDVVKFGESVLEVLGGRSLTALTQPGVALLPVVVGRDVMRRYGEGETTVHALRGVSVDIASARLTAIMGPSGSGKSTLMHILAGLDRPTSGSVLIGGTDITKLDDAELTALRRDRVGFIFQFFNLLPMLTAEKNVLLPLKIAGREPDGAFFEELLERVGLADRRKHRPAEMSGGQQQRVAIARAFITKPAVVFADEPTGNLDSATGAEVLGLMRQFVGTYGQTTVMVTHDPHAAAVADRVLFLADGHIVNDLGPSTAKEILEAMDELSSPRP
jgi:putative ABC transport system ATP-binding protein